MVRKPGLFPLALCLSLALHGSALLFLRSVFPGDAVAQRQNAGHSALPVFSLVNIAVLEPELPPDEPPPTVPLPAAPSSLILQEPADPTEPAEHFLPVEIPASATLAAEVSDVPVDNAPVMDDTASSPGISSGAFVTSAASSAPTGSENNGRVAEYVRRNYEYIQRSVKRTLKYPAQAKRARFQGTAQVVFTINRDGTVSGLVLRVSSGAAVLDEAALDAIRRAAPFRPPPAPAKILLPVVFSIN